MFELSGARFEINGRCLLQPTDLRFEAGRIYALIGHNGSGKSTLVKLLARQQQATGGTVHFNARSVDDWPARAFAREVAYLPQNPPVASNLNVCELVAFGRYPWHGLLRRMSTEDHAQIDRALDLTHTRVFADRRVDSLSGGERQRVWLAMLLAQGSRFLLLDEPLSALDIAHQVETLSLIRELSHSLGLGVVIVLHDINMVSRYCDHVVALRQGRLLAEGPPGELMDSATLDAIYGIRMNVLSHPQDAVPVAVV